MNGVGGEQSNADQKDPGRRTTMNVSPINASFTEMDQIWNASSMETKRTLSNPHLDCWVLAQPYLNSQIPSKPCLGFSSYTPSSSRPTGGKRGWISTCFLPLGLWIFFLGTMLWELHSHKEGDSRIPHGIGQAQDATPHDGVAQIKDWHPKRSLSLKLQPRFKKRNKNQISEIGWEKASGPYGKQSTNPNRSIIHEDEGGKWYQPLNIQGSPRKESWSGRTFGLHECPYKVTNYYTMANILHCSSLILTDLYFMPYIFGGLRLTQVCGNTCTWMKTSKTQQKTVLKRRDDSVWTEGSNDSQIKKSQEITEVCKGGAG